MHLWTDAVLYPWFMWRLIPVRVEDSTLPQYDGDRTGQPPIHTQHAEPGHDDFGTVVTEVTVVTTRKTYRVEGN